jgi:hypothetical protein
MRILACLGVLTLVPALAAQNKPIVVGVEYAYPGGGPIFAQLGVPAVKHYPDAIPWNEMQKSRDAAIDFSKMDRFVAEYQNAGFQELVIVLKSYSSWASKNGLLNPTPKSEYLEDYMRWVRAVVERYDGDGKDDMPGLKRPVKYFEIGSEFSSFEPEPVEEYVVTLDRAYRAAHQANSKVIVLHAAFMAPTVFKDHPRPEQYPKAFAAFDAKKIKNHGLDGMRRVLDRHKNFDMLNFHALADPLEIEDTVAWLKYEMKQRNVNKPIMISDTTPNPLIAWGPATRTSAPMGIVIPPATEKDRARLADYFNLLLDGDALTTEWTHAFVAADMVKKVVIAAEQGVTLINASFMEDLTVFKTRATQAGAGTSAWAGMADTQMNFRTQLRTILGLRPGFLALQQLQRHIKSYDAVERVKVADSKVRLYEFKNGGQTLWVAWYEPGKLYLPGSAVPATKFILAVDSGAVVSEAMIDRRGQTRPVVEALPKKAGGVELTVTPWPVYVVTGR